MKKRNFLIMALCLIATWGLAQKNAGYSEEDVKQFYRTIQGDYRCSVNDSTNVSVHFTPIWQQSDDRFHWLYMEVEVDSEKQPVEQKIIEIKPVSGKRFKVVVHEIKDAKKFVGKWRNRNFFDGYTTSILKGGKRFIFTKTKDFEYQTGLVGPKNLNVFSKGDTVHFKFVQEGERLYVKRMVRKTSKIDGFLFLKDVTDAD